MTCSNGKTVPESILESFLGHHFQTYTEIEQRLATDYDAYPTSGSLRVMLSNLAKEGKITRLRKSTYCLAGYEPKPANVRPWVLRVLMASWPDAHSAESLSYQFRREHNYTYDWREFDKILAHEKTQGRLDRVGRGYAWYRRPTDEDRKLFMPQPVAEPSIFD